MKIRFKNITKKIWNKIKNAWYRIPDTVRIAAIVFFIVLPAWVVVALILRRFLSSFGEGLLIEAFGMLLDVLIIGIIILWLNEKREKKRRIERWKEEIDDFRGWESEEAKFRIVGNIKRLNRYGITKINLTYCYLENADLTGTDLHGALLQFANLKNTIYCGANLQGALLQQANLQESSFNYSNFQHANLFNAKLEETSLIEANFKGTNLKEADLQRAILNGAKNLTIKQLSEVKTLWLSKLDPDLKKQVENEYPHLLKRPIAVERSM